MYSQRRVFLKGSGAAATVAVAVAAGLLKPGRVLAAEWPKQAFDATTVDEALKGIDAAQTSQSDQITIKAPDIAENGAVVPVEVTSNIPNTQSISILAEKNPQPLVADFNLENGAQGYVSTRIKMGSTAPVRVVVKADGKNYVASKEVKVTIGGCGG